MARIAFALALFSLLGAPAWARQVDGVDVPERITVDGGAAPLLLNGAGVRTKFIFDIYVCALYLPQLAHSTAAILALPGAKRVRMHFLYRNVSAKKIVDAWREGLNDNLGRAELEAMAPRLARFYALFPDMHRGDEVLLDYIPDQGTRVSYNGTVRGVVPGADLFAALLRVWLGEHPADAELKPALLGSS